MADSSSFSKFVPGFEFLQGLVKNAGAALPGIGQWVAPTLNPEELSKRIEELRTVQFWLEQNARMLGATIQALEVQRMTLSTLKTMNVSLGDLTESMKIRMPEPAARATPAPAPQRPARRLAAMATTTAMMNSSICPMRTTTSSAPMISMGPLPSAKPGSAVSAMRCPCSRTTGAVWSKKSRSWRAG